MMKLIPTLFIAVLWASQSLCAPSALLQRKQVWQEPNSSLSTVPFGAIIQSCTVPGTVALTFDDGPYIYTGQVLDELAANGVKATFMLNGQNLGNIYDNAALVQRMIAEGHQVGSHTYVYNRIELQVRQQVQTC
jgi:peptidoglycan/xylan/chitin deacetylase (PgdA/CDA1 family)